MSSNKLPIFIHLYSKKEALKLLRFIRGNKNAVLIIGHLGRFIDGYDYEIKYNEDIGYFVLQGERGIFSLQKGFPAKSKEEARFHLLENEFLSVGLIYEAEHRDELETV